MEDIAGKKVEGLPGNYRYRKVAPELWLGACDLQSNDKCTWCEDELSAKSKFEIIEKMFCWYRAKKM